MNLKYELPDGFLNEEERCGYVIPANMKKAWAVQLDLLQELMRVCKEHDIRMFVAEGTLLGTVRHKGFIPWDDDIDVVLTRGEYDKLMECADDFKHPYFLQSIYTDEGYRNRHAQLRMNNTLALGKNEKKGRRCHQGIFIDIFVLDAMPNSPRAFKHHYAKISKAKLRLKIVNKLMERLPINIYKWCRKHTSALSDIALYRKYENVMRKVPFNNRTCSGAMICQNMSLTVFPVSAYQDVVMLPFEHIMVPAPIGYDQLLTIEYGDYMTPVKAPSLHGEMLFETDL